MASPGIVLQHEETAPPGLLGEWLERRGIPWRLVEVRSEGLPELAGAPWLVVLGSRESAGAEAPEWIPAEIELLREAVARELPTFGICFGSQALAVALGGGVEPARPLEAGWDVRIEVFDPEIPAGPWVNFHLERFTLPAGARLLARTAVGPAAFRHGPHLGVQFHPEATPELVAGWADRYSREHPEVDPAAIAAAGKEHGEAAARRAFELFERWWTGLAPG